MKWIHNGAALASNWSEVLIDRPGPAYFIISGSILLLCSILAGLGNSIIIIVLVRKRAMKTVTHILIANLAMAHLLISIFCVPVQAVVSFSMGVWPSSDILCKAVRSLHAVFSSAAILTLSVIAIDRYFSVVYPFEQKITMFKGKLLIFYVWLHAVVICLPTVFVYKLDSENQCEEKWNYREGAQVYLLCYTIFTLFGPLLVTCLAYCFVWRTFRLSQRRVNVTNPLKRPRAAAYMPYASKTEIRLLKMLFVMVFCFVIFWAPFVTYRFLYIFGRPGSVLSGYFILSAVWFCKLEPVLDPIIYGYLNKHFRQGLCEMLKMCPCMCFKNLRTDVTLTTGDRSNFIPSPSGDLKDHWATRRLSTITGQRSEDAIAVHTSKGLNDRYQLQNYELLRTKYVKLDFHSRRSLPVGQKFNDTNTLRCEKTIRDNKLHVHYPSEASGDQPTVKGKGLSSVPEVVLNPHLLPLDKMKVKDDSVYSASPPLLSKAPETMMSSAKQFLPPISLPTIVNTPSGSPRPKRRKKRKRFEKRLKLQETRCPRPLPTFQYETNT